MRRLLTILAAIVLSGCVQPGMEFRQPMLVKNPDGTSSAKSVRIAAFAVDFVGLKKFSINYKTGECTIEFQEDKLGAEQYVVLDANGKAIGTLTRDIVPGIYVARVIDAYGEAGKKITDAIGSLITGALLSGTTPLALGKGLSAIPIK